ncbi:alpha/beta fold hydrolase [Cohnella sp. GCM10027633]|uniref:alpha/beta fold hydrolase n=1 Tax=unclassified Cohnella TaxID=2636738 RepID=UPI003628DA60
MSSVATHTFGDSRYIRTADGRRLHYMEKGEGDVTVVFESGMGFSRSTWGLVQPLVASHARAVVYDRAGTGRSEPDPESRTLERIADDLNGLLTELGPGPFILVGHSWGGPIVRTAAALDPTRIRGLVLVDPSDEHCELYFAEASLKHFARMNKLIPLLARLGLYRLMGSVPGRVQPPDVYSDHRREDFTVQAAKAMVAEGLPFVAELQALRDRAIPLGETEVALISGTHVSRMERKIRPALHEAHRKTVAALPAGRLIEATRSGHMINYSEPGLIADEIKRMIDSYMHSSILAT